MQPSQAPMGLHAYTNYTQHGSSLPLASNHDALLPEDDRRTRRSKSVQ
jgi:hypothetical protein